jgi:hypothetical protein
MFGQRKEDLGSGLHRALSDHCTRLYSFLFGVDRFAMLPQQAAAETDGSG